MGKTWHIRCYWHVPEIMAPLIEVSFKFKLRYRNIYKTFYKNIEKHTMTA